MAADWQNYTFVTDAQDLVGLLWAVDVPGPYYTYPAYVWPGSAGFTYNPTQQDMASLPQVCTHVWPQGNCCESLQKVFEGQ